MIDSEWLYKVKHVVDDNIDNFKAIFVERGLS